MINPVDHQYDDYLRDESRRIGFADAISFPTTEDEVARVIRQMGEGGGRITVQGARTGIVGGAVPQGGTIFNLSRMKTIGPIREEDGEYALTVQPGALLSEVQEAAAAQKLLFPPDPTEISASIGGMVAYNASGAETFLYGSTRHWVRSLRVVLSDGDVLALRRGADFADGRRFSLTTENGRVISGCLPGYRMPNVKSAAGYYVADDMDLIDLFIGMEGTLGVVTEIDLRLITVPGAINGLAVFLPSQEAALKLVRVLRGDAGDEPSMRPAAIEFFNSDALNLLRAMKSSNPAFENIPALKPHFHTAIYTEFHGDSDDALEEPVMRAMDALIEFGGSDEDTWFATNHRELEPIKAFRHAIPEAVNLLIDERRRNCADLTKLGTDMSVPDVFLESAMDMYDSGLRENALESVIFGHIGNNHVHVNILPRSLEEYETGKSLYLKWAKRVVDEGGSVSAEHGIGKAKTAFLELMYGPQAVAEMKSLKLLFDPSNALNPGNLFP